MNNRSQSAILARLCGWLVAAILFILPFHALLTTWIGSNTGHFDLLRIWKELLITALSLPCLWLILRRPALKQWFAESWTVRLIFLYSLLTIGMGIWARHEYHVNSVALIYGLLVNLRFLGFFLICLVVASYNPWLKKSWAKLTLLPASLVIIFGLMQRLLLPFDFLRHFGYGAKTIPAYQTVDSSLDYRRIQSTLRGANPLGAYMVLIVPGFVSLKDRLKKWVGVTAGLAIIFFSYSRSAWIGAALALAFLAWLALKQKVHWHYLAISIGLGAIAVSAGLYFFGSQKSVQETLLHYSSGSVASQSSNSERYKAIKSAAANVWHKPLGSGTGTAGPASFRNNHPPRIAENYYLQIGQEVGVAGIVLFIVINILVGKQLWLRRTDTLSSILLAALVGISFINLLSHAWTDDTLSLIWWGLAGIALAPVNIKKKNHGRI